ncbi:Nn.00g038710.m01.CDS01 [Neocucurbitaria sp. VM-36]
MKLINTLTYKLQEFFNNDAPKYAILSHTWEEEEILFHDINNITHSTRNKLGFKKVQGACSLARSHGYQWIWIDTYCIDKSNSAELTEAINSMFRYYQEAEVCYVYLKDVTDWESNDRSEWDYPKNLTDWRAEEITKRFRRSRWFTRGWTLQELIAPATVEFYTAKWSMIGLKTEKSLSVLISEITGIDLQTLNGGNVHSVTIARRMHWASKRETTRVEDRAYSLLGLFDVNMPMIYGEGIKAFRRLQEEILKSTDDQSIFAWNSQEYLEGTAVDVFASSPSDFVGSGAIAREPFYRVRGNPTTITNQGVIIELPIMSVTRLDMTEFTPYDEVEAILDCQIGSVPGTFPKIRLRSLRATTQDGPKHYIRIMTGDTILTFKYFDRRSFITAAPIVGLDPTQLHIDAYKEALDKNHLQWKMESIILARMRPQIRELKSEPSWSLSLLASHYPPDNTGYWVLCFKAHDIWTNIVNAHPAEDWDVNSMQMRVMSIPREYYAVGRFRFIDAVLQVSMSSSLFDSDHREFATLLIGRQADHRRMIPQPWCRFLDYPNFSRAAQIVSSCQQESITRDPEANTSSTTYRNHRVMASVKAKEISGVFHYVVSIIPVEEGADLANIEMLLCNDIYDRQEKTSLGVQILKF